MKKNIRQFIISACMVGILLAVTTVNLFAASWHASTEFWWITQNACLNQIQVMTAWHEGNQFRPPINVEFHAYTWIDDGPGGPVVSPDPTWVPASDQAETYLGSVNISISPKRSLLVYERTPGNWVRTNIWGTGRIVWDPATIYGLEVGDGIFVRTNPPEGPDMSGFVLEIQDCGS
ncbi:MAG: hypothetical protein AAF702_37255 [Chloroflexota bacterium]